MSVSLPTDDEIDAAIRRAMMILVAQKTPLTDSDATHRAAFMMGYRMALVEVVTEALSEAPAAARLSEADRYLRRCGHG